MSGDGGSGKVPPFPPGYRASGVLLHVTSLPSPYGIGDLGSAAFSWIDRLHTAGQRWWQVLPLGPTGYGDSPYQSMSSFAGNPGLISPDSLISDGLLKMADCQTQFSPHIVEYDAVIPFKTRLVETAWANFKAGDARICARPTTSSAHNSSTGSTITHSSKRSRPDITASIILSGRKRSSSAGATL